MSPIELTREHREKLLEMCERLFPEYSKFWFSVTTGHNFILEASIPGSKILVPGLQMHWFEFVMCYLVVAIQEALPEELVWSECPPYVGNVYSWKKGDKWTLYSKFMFHYPKAMFGGSHLPHNPIDYLYTEFQNIKK